MALDRRERGGRQGRIETALLCLLLFGIIVLAGLQILLRNFFSYSLFWADELIRFAVLWLAMVGGMAAAQDGRHLAIGIVAKYLPGAWHRPAAIAAMIFAAIVTAVLAWQGYRFVADSFDFGDTVLDGRPAWVFQAIVPLGFAVMSYRFARHALRDIRRRSP